MLHPPELTPAELAIARLVKPGDYVMPSSEMIRTFSLTRPQYIVTRVRVEAGISQSDILIRVRSLNDDWDAAWFRWTGELPLHPSDPVFSADQPTLSR